MDEFNKNENEQEELELGSESTALENEAPVQPEDELMKELEGIRDMLQNELDGKPSDELIQELDEIKESADGDDEQKAPAEENLCECCGERVRDTSFGEDYPYCRECRDIMKANPIRFISAFTAIIMVAVAVLSLYFCIKSIDDYTLLIDAQEAYSSSKLTDAESYYGQYFNTKTPDSNVSMNAVKNFLDLSIELGYYNYASQLVDDYFTESQLKLPWNRKYAGIKDEYEKLSATTTDIAAILQDAFYGKEFDLDEKLAELDALLENKEEKNYSEIIIEYYKFAAMSMSGAETSAQLEQLKKVEALDPDRVYQWIYIRNLTAMAGMAGDLELTQACADRCLELNKQEFYAYSSLANAYRYSGNLDAEKLLELANEAQQATPADAAPLYYQIYAMAYLLQEKNDEAMQAMESYMQSQQYSVQAVNLYALCCLVVDDSEGYESAQSILKTGGFDIADCVKQFEKGKLTIEQVLSDNGGEI